MKANKGFTLIELLAVIVILAVIALIATPLVMNLIAEARKGAARDAMYHYIEAVEYEIGAKMVTSVDYSIPSTVDHTFVSVKGTAPKSGSLSLDASGRIVSGWLQFGAYTVSYTATNGGEATIVDSIGE